MRYMRCQMLDPLRFAPWALAKVEREKGSSLRQARAETLRDTRSPPLRRKLLPRPIGTYTDIVPVIVPVRTSSNEVFLCCRQDGMEEKL